MNTIHCIEITKYYFFMRHNTVCLLDFHTHYSVLIKEIIIKKKKHIRLTLDKIEKPTLKLITFSFFFFIRRRLAPHFG